MQQHHRPQGTTAISASLPPEWDEMNPQQRMSWRNQLGAEARDATTLSQLDLAATPERVVDTLVAAHRSPTARRGFAVARNVVIPSAVHLAATTLLEAAREGGDDEVRRVLAAGGLQMKDVVAALEANGNWFAACNLKARFPALLE